ncbi:hypothetical protein [Reinekea thalattae]|uniref:Uncharacterized protein n=1 Tax=Reinekea thalattae TaxID=2593301 RepID=A0A5C8Z3G8_9GAMM|nr:hypothetical protein [Reinekea thalattae]TXR52087.1 hypothetical protein FME95_11775 [Reinekea thalattae]
MPENFDYIPYLIAGGFTILGAIITTISGFLLQIQSHKLNIKKEKLRLRKNKIEDLYIEVCEWERDLYNIKRIYEKHRDGELQSLQESLLELDSYNSEPMRRSRINMILDIYIKELKPDFKTLRNQQINAVIKAEGDQTYIMEDWQNLFRSIIDFKYKISSIN